MCFSVHTPCVDEKRQQTRLSRGNGGKGGEETLRSLLQQSTSGLCGRQGQEWCISGHDASCIGQRRSGDAGAIGSAKTGQRLKEGQRRRIVSLITARSLKGSDLEPKNGPSVFSRKFRGKCNRTTKGIARLVPSFWWHFGSSFVHERQKEPDIRKVAPCLYCTYPFLTVPGSWLRPSQPTCLSALYPCIYLHIVRIKGNFAESGEPSTPIPLSLYIEGLKYQCILTKPKPQQSTQKQITSSKSLGRSRS